MDGQEKLSFGLCLDKNFDKNNDSRPPRKPTSGQTVQARMRQFSKSIPEKPDSTPKKRKLTVEEARTGSDKKRKLYGQRAKSKPGKNPDMMSTGSVQNRIFSNYFITSKEGQDHRPHGGAGDGGDSRGGARGSADSLSHRQASTLWAQTQHSGGDLDENCAAVISGRAERQTISTTGRVALSARGEFWNGPSQQN